MVGLIGDTETTGVGNTITCTVSIPTQPFASVPETVYVVVTVGLSVTGEPCWLTGCHVYVLALEAESVTDAPMQMPVGEATGWSTGSGIIDTVTFAVF